MYTPNYFPKTGNGQNGQISMFDIPVLSVLLPRRHTLRISTELHRAVSTVTPDSTPFHVYKHEVLSTEVPDNQTSSTNLVHCSVVQHKYRAVDQFSWIASPELSL